MFAVYGRNTERAVARLLAGRMGVAEPVRAPQPAPEPEKPLAVFPEGARPILTPLGEVNRAVDLVARMHGVSVKELMSVDKTDRVVTARYAAFAAVREMRPLWSKARIGRFFNRDGTTVLYALMKWDGLDLKRRDRE